MKSKVIIIPYVFSGAAVLKPALDALGCRGSQRGIIPDKK